MCCLNRRARSSIPLPNRVTDFQQFEKNHSARSGFFERLPIERQLIYLHTSWERYMRKIATLALAAGLSIAALAPAAFANQGECTGKQFANAIQTAQESGKRGQEKKAWASTECLPPAPAPTECVPISLFDPTCQP